MGKLSGLGIKNQRSAAVRGRRMRPHPSDSLVTTSSTKYSCNYLYICKNNILVYIESETAKWLLLQCYFRCMHT